MSSIFQKVGFVLRYRYSERFSGTIRKWWYTIWGMKVGKSTFLPRIFVTWPHQVSIGNNCIIEHHTFFKFDGIWQHGPSICIADNVFIGSGCEFNIHKRITIGNDTLIASGCRFIDHNHGISNLQLIRLQQSTEQEIILRNNVWLGCNVTVLKGVQINEGAIVAAGAVVTKNIPSGEIWAGVPAKKIGNR